MGWVRQDEKKGKYLVFDEQWDSCSSWLSCKSPELILLKEDKPKQQEFFSLVFQINSLFKSGRQVVKSSLCLHRRLPIIPSLSLSRNLVTKKQEEKSGRNGGKIEVRRPGREKEIMVNSGDYYTIDLDWRNPEVTGKSQELKTGALYGARAIQSGNWIHHTCVIPIPGRIPVLPRPARSTVK